MGGVCHALCPAIHWDPWAIARSFLQKIDSARPTSRFGDGFALGSPWVHPGFTTLGTIHLTVISRVPPSTTMADTWSALVAEPLRHCEDSDERAVANIGGGAPNRWGKGDKYHKEAWPCQMAAQL